MPSLEQLLANTPETSYLTLEAPENPNAKHSAPSFEDADTELLDLLNSL